MLSFRLVAGDRNDSRGDGSRGTDVSVDDGHGDSDGNGDSACGDDTVSRTRKKRMVTVGSDV
ncbi:hypothetical protein C493_11992 [Natronolimnohabitans innermongolicus JCM 12255]|uniref:Uncharacterized protein n=1 Tax=Natronolimnohabitans innermongolicus JCM 12255 TaxID=1227499 RepID=L9X3C5_9EURY|nr:hypothetical protein C493_11992 [Natronolimnohabitans innermongolicus JCM 12255]